MAHRPVGAGSSFLFSAGAASTSSAFSVQSSALRVVAVGGATHISVGFNPSATSEDYYVPSGATATLALSKSSNSVSNVIRGDNTEILVSQGTQVPFNVGDFVSLIVVGQSYYDFTHQEVLSIDNTAGVNGYHQTRMIVNHDSSGIATAFSSPNATIIASNKVSAYGVDSGTVYYQQVQISGDA
jgi:hypothetical protein